MTAPAIDLSAIRTVVYAYSLDADGFSWEMTPDGSTHILTIPSAYEIGDVMAHVRTVVPAEVIAHAVATIPALRRQAEIAELAHGADPVEAAPVVQRVRRHARCWALFAGLGVTNAVLAYLDVVPW